jgi:hypothetical protein
VSGRPRPDQKLEKFHISIWFSRNHLSTPLL